MSKLLMFKCSFSIASPAPGLKNIQSRPIQLMGFKYVPSPAEKRGDFWLKLSDDCVSKGRAAANENVLLLCCS